MECLKRILWKNPSKDQQFQIPRPDPQRNMEKPTVSKFEYDEKILFDKTFQKLFRIFLIFSSNYENSILDSPSSVSSCEDNLIKQNGKLLIFMVNKSANFLIHRMHQINQRINQHYEMDLDKNQYFKVSIFYIIKNFKEDKIIFRDFVEKCKSLFPIREHFNSIIDRIFERYVRQIVSKGFIMCRETPQNTTNICYNCCFGPTRAKQLWHPYWCVLMPGTMYLYPVDEGYRKADPRIQQKMRKCILVNNETLINTESSMVSNDVDNERLIWRIQTPNESLQFSTFDELQRQMWITAHNTDWNSLLRHDKATFKALQRCDIKKPIQIQPSQSKTKILTLKLENERLSQILDAERKALKDEEIVRQLATRMLDEEMERSDHFRKTIEFLTEELTHERQHRIFLEKRLFEATEIVERDHTSKDPFFPNNDQNEINYDKQTNELFKDYLIISTQSV